MTYYEKEALKYAENIGIVEYKVNGPLMEYWSFYDGEGWYFVRYDLNTKKEVFRGGHIPWKEPYIVPAFLKGGLLYNYNIG